MNSEIDEFVTLLGKKCHPFTICGETGVGKKYVADRIFSSRAIPERFRFAIDCAAFGTDECISIVDTCFRKKNEVALVIDGLESSSSELQSYLCEQLESLRRHGFQEQFHIACLLNSHELECVRKDLWYMVSSAVLEISPLRDRPGNIITLAKARIAVQDCRSNDTFLDALGKYRWPGNVDELFSVIDGAILRANEAVLGPEHLPSHLVESEIELPVPSGVSLKDLLAEYERKIIVEALRQSAGNKTKAAQLLQITERIIGLRCSNLDIDPRQYRRLGPRRVK